MSGRFPRDVCVPEVMSLLLSKNEVQPESASCCFITLYLRLFLTLVSSMAVHMAVFIYCQILRFHCPVHAADCVAITVLDRCSPEWECSTSCDTEA